MNNSNDCCKSGKSEHARKRCEKYKIICTSRKQIKKNEEDEKVEEYTKSEGKDGQENATLGDNSKVNNLLR